MALRHRQQLLCGVLPSNGIDCHMQRVKMGHDIKLKTASAGTRYFCQQHLSVYDVGKHDLNHRGEVSFRLDIG